MIVQLNRHSRVGLVVSKKVQPKAFGMIYPLVEKDLASDHWSLWRWGEGREGDAELSFLAEISKVCYSF